MEALIDAAAEHRLDAYLSQGHCVNVSTDNGITALHALARKGSGSARDRVALNALLAAGIEVNNVNMRNETALFRAVFTQSNWMCESLIEHGARTDILDKKGRSLEDIASIKNVEMLIIIRAWMLDRATPAAKGRSHRRSL